MESLAADLGVYLGTFVVCFLAGLIPVINTEVWLVAMGVVVAEPLSLAAVVLLATAGEMIAKVVLYYASLGVLRLPMGRYQRHLERARAKVAQWRHRPLYVLWASATVGLPPFYLIALVTGPLGLRLRTFCVIGTIGRALRFGALVALAWLGAAA